MSQTAKKFPQDESSFEERKLGGLVAFQMGEKLLNYLRRTWVFVFLVSIGSLPPVTHAQSPSYLERVSRHSLEIEADGAVADGHLEGTVEDRQLYLVGLSYRFLLRQNNTVAVRYTFEAIPLAALREPFFLTGCQFAGPNRCVAVPAIHDFPMITHRRTSYGMGASPAGIEVSFLPSKHIQPFFGIRGGFIYFNRNVLSVFASQLNFTIDGRAGIRIPLRSGKDISFAYMFQHLSNADIGRENPGLDSHMISLTYSFRWPFGQKKQ